MVLCLLRWMSCSQWKRMTFNWCHGKILSLDSKPLQLPVKEFFFFLLEISDFPLEQEWKTKQKQGPTTLLLAKLAGCWWWLMQSSTKGLFGRVDCWHLTPSQVCTSSLWAWDLIFHHYVMGKKSPSLDPQSIILLGAGMWTRLEHGRTFQSKWRDPCEKTRPSSYLWPRSCSGTSWG